MPVSPLGTTHRQTPKECDGFVSEGVAALTRDVKVTPVAVLRDTVATQSLLLDGVIELPSDTDLKVPILVTEVCGCSLSLRFFGI